MEEVLLNLKEFFPKFVERYGNVGVVVGNLSLSMWHP
jgi:hypothetical protein